jgi:hypothetical protein
VSTHKTLLVLVPSRGRPQSVAEMAKAWEATNTKAHLLYVVDDDDLTLPEYATACRDFWVGLRVGKRLRLGPTLNAVATDCTDRAEAIAFLGDDHRPRTPGWDAALLAELDALGHGIAYGNDLLQGPNLPTAVVMSSSIVQALGYFCPPGLIHMYLDNFWAELGRGANCLAYRGDVIIEHVHPEAGKAEDDAGYVEARAHMDPDCDRWRYYVGSGSLAADIEKIKRLRDG